MNPLQSGTLAGTGSFRCEACGYVVTLQAAERLERCASCGENRFARASLFAVGAIRPGDAESDAERADLITEARLMAEGDGPWLAFREGGATRVVALNRPHLRIGRSLAAEIRLDDSTVSRRHALIVLEAGDVKVLDDQSLNGVFVNGERVQRQVLHEGDELMVGRYRLRFLAAGGSAVEAGTGSLEAAAG